MAFAPVFIVGVPRSGTTLLRVLLDSHSEIMALPETPWLLGAYGPEPSLRGVLKGLIEGPYGAVRNVSGVQSEHVLAAGRQFLAELFEPVLTSRGKKILVFKTPADIRHLEFLTDFLPDALYIHVTRDGRDVALSQLAKKGSFFKDLKEYRRVTYANVFRRWVEWEQRIRNVLYRAGLRVIHLRYEDLIADPRGELNRLTGFLGVTFEDRMLDYASADHDYPNWEAGSTDVALNDGVSGASVGRWRNTKITPEILYTLRKYDDFLVALGYPASGLAPSRLQAASAVLFPLTNAVLDIASRFNGLVRPLIADRPRVIACASLVLLSVQFVLSGRFAFGSDSYQPILSFVTAVSVALGFGPALSRRSKSANPRRQTFLTITALLLGCVGGLEIAQNFAPERHAAFSDFLVNSFAVLLAALSSIVLFGREPSRQHPA